jgi:hypothetical protein
MGRVQAPRHRSKKKAKLFSAQADVNQNAMRGLQYNHHIITTPRSGRDLTCAPARSGGAAMLDHDPAVIRSSARNLKVW